MKNNVTEIASMQSKLRNVWSEAEVKKDSSGIHWKILPGTEWMLLSTDETYAAVAVHNLTCAFNNAFLVDDGKTKIGHRTLESAKKDQAANGGVITDKDGNVIQ